MMNCMHSLALAAALVLATGAAHAHGDWPAKHGGLMSEGGEITMELVQAVGRWVIYVEDHGEPVDVQAAAGQLDIAESDGKTGTLTLTPSGGNRVELTGPLALRAGMRLTAFLKYKNGIELKARFRI